MLHLNCLEKWPYSLSPTYLLKVSFLSTKTLIEALCQTGQQDNFLQSWEHRYMLCCSLETAVSVSWLWKPGTVWNDRTGASEAQLTSGEVSHPLQLLHPSLDGGLRGAQHRAGQTWFYLQKGWWHHCQVHTRRAENPQWYNRTRTKFQGHGHPKCLPSWCTTKGSFMKLFQ